MTTHHGSHSLRPSHPHLLLFSHKQTPTAAAHSFLYLFPASSCWRCQSFLLHGEQQHGRVFLVFLALLGQAITTVTHDWVFCACFSVCLALEIFCINVFCLLFCAFAFKNGGSKEEGRGNAYVFLCTTRDRDTMTRSMSADLAAPCLYCFLRHAILGIQAFLRSNGLEYGIVTALLSH